MDTRDSELSAIVSKFLDQLRQIKDDLVTVKECELTQRLITQKLSSSEAALIAKLEGIPDRLHGSMEDIAENVAHKILTDGEFLRVLKRQFSDVTARHELSKLSKSKKPSSWTRVVEACKSIYAVILLAALAISSCVVCSYYVAGAANVLKRAAQEQADLAKARRTLPSHSPGVRDAGRK